MFEFLEYVLYLLKNGVILGVLACMAGALVLAVAYGIHRKKYGREGKFPLGRALLWLVLVGYLTVVAYATLMRWDGGGSTYNLHLFRAWREAWNNFSAKNWANVLLNVAMFLPMGLLLPLLWKKFRKWYVAIPTGFAASLAIELVQLITGRGLCDVDDLFCNTLGALIGYLAVMTAISLFGEKRKKAALAYGCGTLGCILAICSIFVVYEIREYGNLPEAAAYRVDMGGISWTLGCELPDVGGQVPVYQNQVRSIENCDTFAAEFESIIGTRLDDISYYQEAAYYLCHGGENGYHFLHVHYLDTGFEYSCGDLGEEPVWVEAHRETVEKALEQYPVSIPEFAEFTAEGEGWYSFSVEQYVQGDTMTDGILRCRYSDDGCIREIENDLLTYTYYDLADILSPEEACKQLYRGNFSTAEAVRYYARADVTVTDCRLGYSVDTKGFYQPVYLFTLTLPGQEISFQALIPAMK